MARRTCLTVVGARPQFVKAAAVSRAFAADGRIVERIVHTGQHFDAAMSDRFFEELGIPAPKHDLGIAGLGHGAMTGRMLERLDALMREEAPSAVLVYGDTNSTLAGALAASKLGIPLVHVEAGLRSFNRAMPEEINRVVTDHVSDLLLCPTGLAVENLRREGIERGVRHVGDVMFDATLFAAERSVGRSTVLADLDLAPGGYALATVHRAENTDDPARLAEVMDYLSGAAEKRPVILPLHPRTKAALARTEPALARTDMTPRGVRVIAPVGYLDMNRLLAGAALVMTDSGGLQKEAYFHRVPCITLREETEWRETVDAGWNRLWKTPETDVPPRREIADYGTGQAAHACVDAIADHLDASSRQT